MQLESTTKFKSGDVIVWDAFPNTYLLLIPYRVPRDEGIYFVSDSDLFQNLFFAKFLYKFHHVFLIDNLSFYILLFYASYISIHYNF